MRTFSLAWAIVFSALLLPFAAKAGAENAPRDTSHFNNAICPGQSLFIGGNIFDAQNLSGAIVLAGESWDGTDSVIIVQLSLSAPVTKQIQASYCSNQALVVNGHVYDANHPTGTELLPGAAIGGCDSLIDVMLTFLSPAKFHLKQTICSNDTVWVNNQAYDKYYYQGMETLTAGAANGCDSVILIDLSILPVAVDTFEQTICPTASLKLNGTVYDKKHPDGIETLPNFAQNGCDSIVYVSISFYDPLDEPDFLGKNQSVGLGEPICLTVPENLNATAIKWSEALPCTDVNCASVCFWAARSKWLICSITDENACVFSDSLRIEVSKNRPVFIPNIFAPDAPPPNNHFQVFSGIPGTRIAWLRIWDRWGSLLYSKTDFDADASNSAWDGMVKGKLAQPGVYAYAVKLFYPDGENEIRSGTVTLAR